MGVARRFAVILLVLLSCVGCDRVSKSYAQSRLLKSEPLSLFAGSVRLRLAYNEGAFLSLGASLPREWRQALVRAGAAVAGFGREPRLRRRSKQSDRQVHVRRYVVDFINVGIGPVRTGIFNVADVAIMAGILMLLTMGLSRRTLGRRG